MSGHHIVGDFAEVDYFWGAEGNDTGVVSGDVIKTTSFTVPIFAFFELNTLVTFQGMKHIFDGVIGCRAGVDKREEGVDIFIFHY